MEWPSICSDDRLCTKSHLSALCSGFAARCEARLCLAVRLFKIMFGAKPLVRPLAHISLRQSPTRGPILRGCKRQGIALPHIGRRSRSKERPNDFCARLFNCSTELSLKSPLLLDPVSTGSDSDLVSDRMRFFLTILNAMA